ncbi:hypothetical protein EDB89DRAFT_852703 [Lactarius sanguifluus]|nr:hypothetical protein EDB89DRAFT_852703 [Lactarius sanguifluus]
MSSSLSLMLFVTRMVTLLSAFSSKVGRARGETLAGSSCWSGVPYPPSRAWCALSMGRVTTLDVVLARDMTRSRDDKPFERVINIKTCGASTISRQRLEIRTFSLIY